MKPAIWIGVVVATIAAVGTATANARTVVYPTTITHDGSLPVSGGDVVDTGRVRSRSLGCVGRRRVVLLARYRDGTRSLLDSDLTSIGGAWSTEARYTGGGFVRVTAKVARRVYRVEATHGSHHRHRRVCKAASISWPVL